MFSLMFNLPNKHENYPCLGIGLMLTFTDEQGSRREKEKRKFDGCLASSRMRLKLCWSQGLLRFGAASRDSAGLCVIISHNGTISRTPVLSPCNQIYLCPKPEALFVVPILYSLLLDVLLLAVLVLHVLHWGKSRETFCVLFLAASKLQRSHNTCVI